MCSRCMSGTYASRTPWNAALIRPVVVGMRRALTTAGLVTAAIALAPGDAPAQAPIDCVTGSGDYGTGANCRVIEVDGEPRRFIVYVPERAAAPAGRPLVFMFHGTSGDGARFLRHSGWREQADDVGFVDAMLADLRARLPLDTARLYASGFSNGGEFTARLAAERSDVFAAA